MGDSCSSKNVTLRQKTVIVGAGPVGALAALYAASRGDEVEVYELRDDLRNPNVVPLNFTKSINLAISERGIKALKDANCPGLVGSVLEETIPMYGRMIHGKKNGRLYELPQAYDIHGRALGAVDRGGLNKKLLDRLEGLPNVKLFFNHKLTGADFKRNLAWLETRDPGEAYVQNSTQVDPSKRAPEVEISFDLMIGADGAHSSVRYHLMKYARVSFHQEYIDTLWCEFHIPPREDNGDFRISPNHLHIWPGRDAMFIAIPSLNKSFTSTLFFPASVSAELLRTPSRVGHFFEEKFPGVVPGLINSSDLQKQFATNPHLPLVSIKCSPYHHQSSVVILGDAAHAMVPFYGQGMNAGFEDVRILFDLFNKYVPESGSAQALKAARAAALAEYTDSRTSDAAAINDLALRNYVEMRQDVQSGLYKLRKWTEEQLNFYLPGLGWATQYSRISFGNERYSEIIKSSERQLRILRNTVYAGLVFVSVAVGYYLL